jgi:hypothetical protein
MVFCCAPRAIWEEHMSSFPRILVIAISIVLAAATTGCGSSTMGGNSQPPGLTGNTVASLLLSSSSNNQLSQFTLNFSSISLTSKSGKTVALLAAPQNPEFVHLNGNTEPLVTATIPQDVYVSAMASIQSSSAVCIDLDSTGGLHTSGFQSGAISQSNIAINFPSPITIEGAHMGLVLNLLVSQSISFPSCDTIVQGPTSVTPTFTLTPAAIAAQPTNSRNGLENDLAGVLGTINATARGFQVTSADGLSWIMNTSGATVFRGVSDFSGLASGLPVSLDAAIQSDGSLLATRVSVQDTSAANLTTLSGPLLQIASSQPTFAAFGTLQQGVLLFFGSCYYNFGSATFAISGRLTNLQSLPFAATFTGVNIVPGQNIFLSTHATIVSGGPTYIPAATVTLLPQTLDGTVTAVSNDGGFATYTISLAPYDLFADLAVQAGQTSLLQNPGTVVVYVDNNVQMLNSTPLAVGSALRFYGLVFNDNGTLKMDCAQIADGVAQ